MTNKTKIIIAAISISFVIISLAIVGFINQSQHESTDKETYTDSASGEEISNQNNAPQGSEASLENAIIYPGFSQLLDRGLTPVQIQSIQSTLSEYSLQQTEKFKEVSLVVASVRHILPQGESQTHTITFDIKVNRTDNYYVTVDYSDTDTCVTKLYAADKTTLLIER
jgi:hypothetical protein